MEIGLTASKIMHVIVEALTVEEVEAILVQKQSNTSARYKLTEEEKLKNHYRALLLKHSFSLQ